MMGHHGLRLLMWLAEEAVAENERRRGTAGTATRSGPGRLRAEVRLMYARGDLDRDTYLELRQLAERGALTETDLAEARREAAEMKTLESPEAKELGRAIAGLHRRQQSLERARTDSESMDAGLANQLADLERQASSLEDEAREVVLDDEDRARSLLERREIVLEQTERLRRSADGLRRDIERMEDLGRQLRLQEQELQAAQVRARLGALERDESIGH
ncbi:MAG: hypothetical protein ACYC1C_07640 [Chloroflexota bacterium]